MTTVLKFVILDHVWLGVGSYRHNHGSSLDLVRLRSGSTPDLLRHNSGTSPDLWIIVDLLISGIWERAGAVDVGGLHDRML